MGPTAEKAEPGLQKIRRERQAEVRTTVGGRGVL